MILFVLYFRMTKAQINMIQRDITKWLTASSKLRITSSIQYGKIKSTLAVFESKATPQEAAALSSELGNTLNSCIFNLTLYFRRSDRQSHQQKFDGEH